MQHFLGITMNTLQYYLHQVLNESKISDLIDSTTDIPKDVLDQYQYQLPNLNSGQEHNALKFIIREHRKGNIKPEDAKSKSEYKYGRHTYEPSELEKTFSLYHKHINKLSGDYKNPMTYGDYDHFKNKMTSLDDGSHDENIHYQDNKIIVHKIDSHKNMIDAAKLDTGNKLYTELNGKAKWCISADSDKGRKAYDHYKNNADGAFFTVTNKSNHRKYAVVPHSNDTYENQEIRNEKDEKISPKQLYKMFPSLHNTNINLNHWLR